MSKEQKIPLPWNPNEGCKLDKKNVPTRGNLAEEQDGSIFHRICPGLDISIPKRKDNFIECLEIDDVPKAKLLSENYAIVSFPGLPEVEIPKRLMAHLLSCCLKDRTAGFSFEVAEELDSNNKKAQLWDDGVLVTEDPITTTVSIQLGTTGYLTIGLKLQPKLCFCDEDCGDEDYIHLIVNLDAVYHDEDDDKILQDPDLEITDEQLTKLISEHGGGGGGNPLCSQKLFVRYEGLYNGRNKFSPMWQRSSEFSANLDEDTWITATKAPYLDSLKLIEGGIYKAEYFCEYNDWMITDGQCTYNIEARTRSVMSTIQDSGAGTLHNGEFYFPLDSPDFSEEDTITVASYDAEASTGTESSFFSSTPRFSWKMSDWDSSYIEGLNYSNVGIKPHASGLAVYNLILSSGACATYAFKVVFKIVDISEEE